MLFDVTRRPEPQGLPINKPVYHFFRARNAIYNGLQVVKYLARREYPGPVISLRGAG
jgi:hypothetical protein